jgi:hypothetical protein
MTPKGIIYGTPALFRWLMLRRNARLMALAVPVFLLPQVYRMVTNKLIHAAYALGNPALGEKINVAQHVGAFLFVVCTLTACGLVVFSGWRAFRDFRNRHGGEASARGNLWLTMLWIALLAGSIALGWLVKFPWGQLLILAWIVAGFFIGWSIVDRHYQPDVKPARPSPDTTAESN